MNPKKRESLGIKPFSGSNIIYKMIRFFLLKRKKTIPIMEYNIGNWPTKFKIDAVKLISSNINGISRVLIIFIF
jgi:hypothetical protein